MSNPFQKRAISPMAQNTFAPSSSAQATFLWHDYETGGTHKQLDRPTQFAAVRTDLDLNIVGQEVMIYCKPSPETLMRPIAAAITGITPQECEAKGMLDVEFCREVLAELGRPGTCGVGYNTISFDDEVTRNMLYRNFHDPYEREWKSGNSRWDLITAVRLFAALRPDGIVWPVKDDGKPSLRLEDLAKANGLKQERAHDALSDVYATIQLAQLLRKTNRKLWDFAFGLREKAAVARLMNVPSPSPFVHVAGYHGHNGTAVMFPIAMHPTNKNGVISLDLGCDLAAVIRLSAEDIASRLFGGAGADAASADQANKANKGAEPEDALEIVSEAKSARLPLTLIQTNKSPSISPLNGLRSVDFERLGYTEEEKSTILANKAFLLENPKIMKDLASTVAEAFALGSAKFDAPPLDPELGIYSGFASREDKAVMDRVRRASPEDLAGNDPSLIFEDEKLNDLLFRYRARNWPESLSASEKSEWLEHCKARLTTNTPATTVTLDEYRAGIDELAQDQKHAAKGPLFADLKAWADQLETRWAVKIPAAGRGLQPG